MLFPYLFAYSVDSVIYLVLLMQDFCLYDVKITREIYRLHGQCSQNTNNVQKMHKEK